MAAGGGRNGAPYDAAERRAPDGREADHLDRLRRHLERILPLTPGLAAHLGDIDPASLTSREALARLPVLRKDALMERQRADPPFGGFLPSDARPPRVFVSPGPIYEPEPEGSDPYRAARALHAAGFRSGDVIVNCFGYHATPGGFILDGAARALGCTIHPAGPGNTAALAGTVRALAGAGPVGYVGTPDFLGTLLDALGQDTDAGPIDRALVSGGALFPAMREGYAARGVTVAQCYATADIGLIAYETLGEDGPHPGMVVAEDLIVEIVTPGTGDRVPEGEVGEVVVTPLDTIWPLVRLATGDLSRVLSGPSPCGRTNMRLAGWMGRADQRTKVKGMFVDPAQLARLRERMPALGRVRLVVAREGSGEAGSGDAMTLLHEGEAQASEVEALMGEVLGLRGRAKRVDELPRDGIVIEDARRYDG